MTAVNTSCAQRESNPSPLGNPPTLIGFAQERRSILDAIRERRSLLLLGPARSGKTALLHWASASNDATLPIVWPFETLHDLLVEIARALFLSLHEPFCRIAPPGHEFERWVRKQTSIHLKGVLWTALEAEPRVLILDDMHACVHRTYRFLERLYHTPGMAILAAARSEVDLGALARLYWDPGERLHLRPLSREEAVLLFDAAVERFELRGLDLDDLRRRVVHASRGNPGQILEMCRLASMPQYVSGGHIKFSLVQIEIKARLLG